jgi:hypothetical protein
MNASIMNNYEEPFFKKIGRKIGDIISTTSFQILSVIGFFLLIIFGSVKFLTHQDEKNYPYGDYELTYRVYYTPSTFVDYTVTHDRPIVIGSHKGTNYVKKCFGEYVIQTNAPIQKIKYVNHQK